MQKRLDEITSFISRGAPVLTVNARLSRSLLSGYDSLMKASGLKAWPTPSILPFSSWLSALYEEHFPDEPLLGQLRAEALWEKIVSEDKDLPEASLYNSGAAGAAFDAYRLIKEYGVRLPEDIYLTGEARALKRWMKRYEAGIKRLGFVDRLTLPQRLAGLIKAKRLPVPEEVVVAGFDEFTPAASVVIEALKQNGVKVSFWPADKGTKGAAVVRAYADEVEEVVQAARWIRTLPHDARIGIIAPELNRYRDIINREFAAELDPASVLPAADERAVFNISLGATLSEEPLVSSALAILSIDGGQEDIDNLARVFFSPYLLDERGRLIFGRLDVELRKENRLKSSLNEIRNKADFGAEITGRLGLWIKNLKAGKKALPSYWAHNLSKLLKDIGWLSHIKLNSYEFQALKAWNSLLEEFAGLDDIIGSIGRVEAISRLLSIAANTMHQPETPDSRVQVLGLLESAGLSFDHIWLLGCHEFAFPPQPSPNPFIPVFIQREYNLPRSSHERELRFSKTVLDRILSSAPLVEASFPLRADDKELKPSPLFKGCEVSSLKIDRTSRLKDDIHSGFVLEKTEEEGMIPVSPEEKSSIRGGTAIIKDQSICPFKAFATHRLKAASIEVPELGLPASKRGTIIHNALRLFWEKVGDSERLKNMIEAGELDDYIKKTAEEALKGIDLSPLSERFMAIERERCESVIRDWVALELERGPFKVKATELETRVDAGGLIITGRLDRVDEDESGREMVIDYKTGEVKEDWLSERPQEPQLFIYSLTGRYDAVSFARIAPGDCRFVGVSRADDKLLPGVKGVAGNEAKFNGMEWDKLMEFWKGVIERLGRDFLEGVCSIDPADAKGQDPCQRCGLTALCRIGGAGADIDGDET